MKQIRHQSNRKKIWILRLMTKTKTWQKQNVHRRIRKKLGNIQIKETKTWWKENSIQRNRKTMWVIYPKVTMTWWKQSINLRGKKKKKKIKSITTNFRNYLVCNGMYNRRS